eukprot:g5202.t1
MSNEIASSFLEWLESAGGFVHKGLDLFHVTKRTNDRGVFAKCDIKKGEQLLLIPNQKTLHLRNTMDTASQSGHCMSLHRVLEANQKSLTPFLRTVLLVLGEMTLGMDSLFFPYIQTLPTHAPASLITWREDDLTLLEGTGLSKNRDNSIFVDLYDKNLSPLMHHHPELWSPEIMSLEIVLNTAAIVQSRVFHLNRENWITNEVHEDSTLYLLPGIDMINHTHDLELSNTELTKIQNEMRVDLFDGKYITMNGCFTMKAEKDIARGEEIVHSYGTLSDCELLRIYGFVSPSDVINPHNELEVKYSELKTACLAVLDQQAISKVSDRERFLQEKLNSQLPHIEFHLKIGQFLSDSMITILQVLLLPDEEFMELQEDSSDTDGYGLILGVSFMDDSEWSEMVIIALFEVIRLKETELKSTRNHKDSTGNEKEYLASRIIQGQQELIQEFKNTVLDLAAMDYDDDSGMDD